MQTPKAGGKQMEAILKYDHVELSYLGQPVVQDVSFSLE